MALAKECAQHVSAFVFGSVAVACGVAGAGALAPVVSGATLITTILADLYEKNQKQGAESKRVLKRIISQVTVAWRDDAPGRSHEDRRDISNASDALIEFLPQCEMSRERLVACATDASALPFPQAATALVMEELADKAPDSFGEASPAIARDFAQAVISAAFQTAIEDRAYFEKLEPHLLFEIARTNGLVISMLSDLWDRLDDLPDQTADAVVKKLPEAFAQLGLELGLTRAQTEAILKNFGHENVPADQWAAKLNESAQRLEELEARLGAPSNDEPEIANLLQAAKAAIDEGDFDEADNLLSEAEERDLEEGQRRIKRSARSRAQRGDLAFAAGRFLDAAEHYAAAAERIKPLDPLDWARLKYNQGTALYERGQYDPEPETLENAVTAYRNALEERTQDRVPLKWAKTQMNLGTALTRIGERESGTARLEEAVTAYRKALEEFTRDRVPLQWAMTQNNLGTALQTLGERESGTVRLEEAVTAFRHALEEWTRDRVPLDWAITQNNLGTALATLDERESGTARLEEAVTAFRNALEEWTRDRVPLDWAMTQNNLGNALQTLGQRESGTTRLEQAVTAYRNALKEYTRDRVPLQWAMTQNNLGNALYALGERGDDDALLQAIACYRLALRELREDNAPYYHQQTVDNLNLALALAEERGLDVPDETVPD